MLSIHDFSNGLVGVRATSVALELRVGRDPELMDEHVLFVDYPAPGADPAGRDVTLAADATDWSAGRAISFRIKPAHAMRLSVSFVDRNRVVYTAWTNLEANTWQAVRIAFDALKPNPYFQLPDAKRGAPLDATMVSGIAFAPQDPLAGSLAISSIEVIR